MEQSDQLLSAILDIGEAMLEAGGEVSRVEKTLTLLCTANILIGLTNTFSSSNSRLAWLNLLCAALLAYGLGRIHGMRDGLEAERTLHE